MNQKFDCSDRKQTHAPCCTFAEDRTEKAVAPRNQILPEVIREAVFGPELLNHRRSANITRAELSRTIGINYSKLAAWELAKFLPPLNMRKKIEQLDSFFNQDGKLVELWLHSNPPPDILSARIYRLHESKWPQRLRRQWSGLVDYRTNNPLQLPRDTFTWSPETIAGLLRMLQGFMGFLVSEQHFKVKGLSLLLLCDWGLVKAFIDFKRSRSGRDFYTHSDEMFVRHYRSIVRSYLILLWTEAERDPYWSDKLPAKTELELEVAPGIKRKQEIQLNGPEEQWAAVVAKAVEKSLVFSRSEKFVKGAYTRLAQSFIDAKATLKEVGSALAERISKLPPKITDAKTALLCRSLAVASLLAVRAFRKGTLERLLVHDIRINEGIVSLYVPAKSVKNRRVIKGPLPKISWVHDIIRRYTFEARPILVGGSKDAGYWFTTYKKRGGRASHTVLYNDVRMLLGVNPHAMRYVLATEGLRKRLPDEESAEILAHTPEMTRKTYQRTDAEDHNDRANRGVEKIYA